jgi:hypothetical protein
MSSKQASEIPPEDKISLSPLDKYRIYGKFPYHMIIHILLLVFNSIQVVIVLSEFTDYFRAQEKSFINALISDDSKEKEDYAREIYLYNISQLQDHISTSIHKMLNETNETFLNDIISVDEDDEEIKLKSIDMNVEYKYNLSKIDKKNYIMPLKFRYKVNENYLGPFNNNYTDDQIKKYLDIIIKFEMVYNIKIYVTRYYKEYKKCFIWKIRQIYDYSKKGHFEAHLLIDNWQCEDKTSLSLSKLEIFIILHLWVHVLVIILAAISALFCLYDFYEVIKLRKYKKIVLKIKKNKIIKDPKILKESEAITHALNKWDILIILSNLFQIIGSLVSLIQQENLNNSMETFVGFGVLFCYISIGKYIDYSPKYSLFYRTFSNSMSNFIPSFLAILPVFIAFTFLGLCLFWNSERFTSVSDIMKGLFALFLGDSIHDIVVDVSEQSNFFGQLYGYLYIILFIIVVMNVLVAIIQEGFIQAKFESKSHWIYNSLQKGNEDAQNENLKNLPNIEEMSQSEIKRELENRIILMNKGLNKCINLIEGVEKQNIDEESKIALRKVLYRKVEEIDKKMEVIRVVWENH